MDSSCAVKLMWSLESRAFFLGYPYGGILSQCLEWGNLWLPDSTMVTPNMLHRTRYC